MYFLSLNPPCTMGVFSGKINGQTTKVLVGLSDIVLWGVVKLHLANKKDPF